tara:strand:+ start:224 stop:1489 length:1266 start_codon:yes stop_codon:yes gene_type:complete
MTKITLKMKGQNVLTNGEGVHDAYIVPTPDHGLDQIPAGPNPRDLDVNSTKGKAIEASYGKGDNKFLIKNGGMQIIIDDGSLEIEDGYLTFTCGEPHSGHYDGQHTQAAVTNVVTENGELNNCVKITFIERSCFDDMADIRGAATAWNSRTSQKARSEYNIMGSFDELKVNISPRYLNNIGWKENQRGDNGNKIQSENEVQQLLRLLATFLPLTYENGMDVSSIAKLAKGGENPAMKLATKEPYLKYMDATYKHADFCLELSDFIQLSLRNVLSEDLFNEFALIKQSSKAQLKKPVSKRSFHSQSLFNGEGSVRGALDKDWLPLFMYAIVNASFEYDAARGEFTQKYTINEAKAIWLECGREVLELFNNEFTANFTSIYKSRKSDFVNQPSKWTQIANMVLKAISTGAWRNRLVTELLEAA